MSYTRNPANTNVRAFPLRFLVWILYFQVLYLSLQSMLRWFLWWCKVRVQVHSFAHGYPMFPNLFVKGTVLSPLCSLVKSIWLYISEFVSGLSILFLWFMNLFCVSSLLFLLPTRWPLNESLPWSHKCQWNKTGFNIAKQKLYSLLKERRRGSFHSKDTFSLFSEGLGCTGFHQVCIAQKVLT